MYELLHIIGLEISMGIRGGGAVGGIENLRLYRLKRKLHDIR